MNALWEKIKSDSNIGAIALGEIAIDTLISVAETHGAHRYLDRAGVPTHKEQRRMTLIERMRLLKEEA
jgi:hypothetical protein